MFRICSSRLWNAVILKQMDGAAFAPDLRRAQTWLHYSYEQSSILSYPPYRLGALPEEAKLVADLQELARLYTEIVSDPLEATVERLVEAVVQPAPQVETVEVSDFEPRVPLRKPEANGRRNPKNRGRYSPESRKVGDAGEKLVMRYEQERLRKLGRHDFADRVRWHTREQEFTGWDITSFDDDGKEFSSKLNRQ